MLILLQPFIEEMECLTFYAGEIQIGSVMPGNNKKCFWCVHETTQFPAGSGRNNCVAEADN